MLRLLRYHLDRIRHPDLTDYISMGLGIEARHERSKKYWAKHLEYTKSFQQRALAKLDPKENLAILGAGRLYDLDLEVTSQFKSVHLYDADPSVLPYWKRFAKQQTAEFHLGDLTQTIKAWSDDLARLLQTGSATPKSKIAGFFSSLKPPAAPLAECHQAIISLNLLSQIPIYWRDRALEKLRPHGFDSDSAILTALAGSLESLQAQHLNTLNDSGAVKLVLITDTDFYQYQNSKAEWDTQAAIGVDPVALLAKYCCGSMDSWLWHLAPQTVEAKDHGWIHRVQAWEFTLRAYSEPKR